MVAYNANLVVNTDADQIVIVQAGPREMGDFPEISYTAGALEDATIRERVGEILEGGEPAFRERAQRVRVQFRR